MNKLKFFFIIILFLIYFKFYKLFKDIFYNDSYFSQILQIKDDEISIVVNMKNLTKNKHTLFYEVMKKFNSTKKYYFIKTLGKPLNETLYKIVENSSIKIVQSNFPDSIFLPFVVSLYGKAVPEFVLFIEGDEIIDNNSYDFIFLEILKLLKANKLDVLFYL